MDFGFFLPERLNVALDTAFNLGSIAAEAALFTLLIRKRAYRRLPVFCFWMLWNLVTDILGVYIRARLGNCGYFDYYMYEMPRDSLMQFGVMVELA